MLGVKTDPCPSNIPHYNRQLNNVTIPGNAIAITNHLFVIFDKLENIILAIYLLDSFNSETNSLYPCHQIKEDQTMQIEETK